MNGVNYLVPANVPEDNLKIIAEDKILVTEPLEVEFKKMQDIESKLLFSGAAAIAILAIGIILGYSVSLVLGACIFVMAIIPFSCWMDLRYRHHSIRCNFDKEKEKCDEIYQHMIDSVRGRYLLLHRHLLKLDGKELKEKGDGEIIQSDMLEPFLQSKVNDADGFSDGFFLALKHWDKQVTSYDLSNVTASKCTSRKFKRYLKIHQLFERSGSDIEADVLKLTKNIEIIAHSNLKPPILQDRWKELQNICRDYAKPYSSSFSIDNDVLKYNESYDVQYDK